MSKIKKFGEVEDNVNISDWTLNFWMATLKVYFEGESSYQCAIRLTRENLRTVNKSLVTCGDAEYLTLNLQNNESASGFEEISLDRRDRKLLKGLIDKCPAVLTDDWSTLLPAEFKF